MIRRTFFQSLLSGIGLGWIVPKAKAASAVTTFPDPFQPLEKPEAFCLMFMHQHEPKVDHYKEVVVYGMRNGRPVCQLIAQHVIVTKRTYGAAAKNIQGDIVWRSPPPYRTESEVNLSGLFGPTPLIDTMVSLFGDVTKAKEMSLVIVEPGSQKRVDVSYALLSDIGNGVGGGGGLMYSHARFLGCKVEEKHDQWAAEDLEFMKQDRVTG